MNNVELLRFDISYDKNGQANLKVILTVLSKACLRTMGDI